MISNKNPESNAYFWNSLLISGIQKSRVFFSTPNFRIQSTNFRNSQYFSKFELIRFNFWVVQDMLFFGFPVRSFPDSCLRFWTRLTFAFYCLKGPTGNPKNITSCISDSALELQTWHSTVHTANLDSADSEFRNPRYLIDCLNFDLIPLKATECSKKRNYVFKRITILY